VISLLLQAGFGFTPLESGLTNTPFSVGVLVISLIVGRFGQNYLRARAAVSAILLTGGMLWLHFIIAGITDTIDHWWFLPPLFIAGMGLGLGFSSLFQLVLSAVPPRDAGAGAGSLQAFQQVGGAVGVALIGQIFFSMLEGAREWGATSVHQAFSVSAATATWYQVVAFGAVFLLVFLLKGKPNTPGQGTARAPAPSVPMEA
jgi:MFS family permease